MSLEHPGELCATAHAKYAEHLAEAIVNGEIREEMYSYAMDEVRMHSHVAEVLRQAKALRAHRAGARWVQAWPQRAPWAGFV